jgi:hypothetical protein
MKPSKKKESTFGTFASSLLPHELLYLCEIQQLKDAGNIDVLETIRYNTEHIGHPKPFDKKVDKRKYSYLKKWITEKLHAIDADVFFEWMIELDKKIMTDAISPAEEIELSKFIRKYEKPNYYFIRFYEMVQNYRYYLLIRMRYNYLRHVSHFLDTFKDAYTHSKSINQELHEATLDIVSQYSSNKTDSKRWEERLVEIFSDETLDGFNRYYAIVRLTFIYYNYKDYRKLIGLYDQLDRAIIQGHIYSKRILVNYYANRVLLHSRYNELQKAEYYGYLSIRFKGSDYLHYVNNLCAILLRESKNTEALSLMRESLPDLKNTISPHNRIGFASFYMQSLNRNGKVAQALSYAQTFLEINRDDIINYRWHLFFTSMLQSLFGLEKFTEILRLVKKFDLLKRETEYMQRAGYIPTLIWYYQIARYKEVQISEDQLLKTLVATLDHIIHDDHKSRLTLELIEEVKHQIPAIEHRLMQSFTRSYRQD